jgi:hypothetical protein
MPPRPAVAPPRATPPRPVAAPPRATPPRPVAATAATDEQRERARKNRERALALRAARAAGRT